MTFYDRYETICLREGIKPVSAAAAEMLNVTRATITQWKTKNFVPKGDTVKIMADVLHVSADYLLGRTDDPTDFANRAPAPEPLTETTVSVIAQETENDVQQEKMRASRIWKLYNQLDQLDRVKLDAYLAGLLSADKYTEVE